MTIKTTYQGKLRTEAIHLRSGNSLITDAPVDNQGKGESFSPTDLVATALGSCMLTIMGIKARDMGLQIEGATADVEKIMGSDPRRVIRLNVIITIPAYGFSAKERKILEKAAATCPVSNSIAEGLQEVTFVWTDDRDNG